MRHPLPNLRSFSGDKDDTGGKPRIIEGDESDFRGGGDGDDVRGGGGGGAGRVFRRLATTRIRWPGDKTRCPRLTVLGMKLSRP